jgi:P4 family phage/plasmid primase-like protien
VQWVREGALEAVETAAEELQKRCTSLATATVIARHLPPIGGRHEYAKAVVGYLLRRLDEESVRQIVLAAWHAGGGDSEEAVRDLEGIIQDTARRLAEDENAFGTPKLEEMVAGLPKLLDTWWGCNSGERARIVGGLVVGDEEPPTHDELRDRFSAANPHHAHGLGEWRHYEAGVWPPVPEFLVKRRIVAVLEEAKPEGIKPTSGLLSSVHELSRVELAVPDEQWDSDQDILVCGNGALHIPTGELLPHSPDHFATGAVPYDYDPDATAPTWERVLEDVLGKELASFFQEFAGYSATPDTSLETALWLCGQPGGGRSTLLAGLETMLGPRAGVLGLGEIERNRFALAQIPGKFLLTATEQPAGYMRASHTLNALISGEPLQVERKFRDPFTLVPRCKIAWAMNELPRLKSTSDGLLRRVKVIELDPIPENERDPEVKNKVKEEGPGILTWALEGQRRVKQRGGFLIPKAVKDATEEFGLTNDVPKSFVQEACLTSKESEEQAGPLYKAYRHYCLEHGHQPMSAKSVAKEWKRLGFGTRTLHGRTLYKGVKVDPKWIGEQVDYPRSQ